MEAQRRLVEVLEARALVRSLVEWPLEQGLNQLAAALEAAISRIDDENWSSARQQLEHLVGFLLGIASACWELPADEEHPNLQRILALGVELCVKGIEFFSTKSDEHMQRKLLDLLELILLDGKPEKEVQFSFAGVAPDFLHSLSSSAHKDEKRIQRSDREFEHQEDIRWTGNILAVLSDEHLFTIDQGNEKKSSRSLLDATQHHAIATVGCLRRLTAVCSTLVSGEEEEQPPDLEGDEFYENISLATDIFSLQSRLLRVSPTRSFLQETLLELQKLVAALPAAIKSSCKDTRRLESDGLNSGSLPALMDSILEFSELLHGDALSENLRTFFAACIVDEMNWEKPRSESSSSSSRVHLSCTPAFVCYFLRLLQADQFHLRDWKRKGVGALEGILKVELRSREFALDGANARLGHLQWVFPGDGVWLDNLVAAAAGLHAQGLKLKPVLDLSYSLHSEEDSATVSMDSLTVASEDDALFGFGDLFSESGRHSVNSEETVQTSSSAKKVEGIHNTLLQCSAHLLRFIREFVFSPSWSRETYEVARGKLSRDHLDAFLEIHSQSFGVVKQGQEVDSEGCSDILSELQKCSFRLMFNLVEQGALSEELQVHLFHQVMKDLSGDALVLLSKLLVSRYRAGGNDQLVMELWRGFTELIIGKVRGLKSFEGDLEKVSGILPSWLHLEVLFMAFHSVESSRKLAILELLGSAMAACIGLKDSSSSSLSSWALLVSRLVIAMKYSISHFDAFDKWLVVDLSKNMRFEGSSKMTSQQPPLLTWAAIFAQRPVHHLIDEHSIPHLFDVDSGSGPQILADSHSYDFGALRKLLGELLGAWSGRFIRTPDELLLERYVFMLAWRIQLNSPVRSLELPALEPESFTSVEFIFSLAKVIARGLRQHSSIDGAQWSGFVLRGFSLLDELLQGGRVKLGSWDLLRQGSSLALLILTLRLGRQTSVGSLVELLVSGGSGEELLRRVSSILQWYVNAASCCLSLALDQHSDSQFNLILRGGFSREKRCELLDRAGANSSVFKSLLRWGAFGSWSIEFYDVLSKGGAGADAETFFMNVLLHGFPLCSYQGNSALVSCMLSIEDLLVAIELLLAAVPGAPEGLLETIMHMKVNSVFESFQAESDRILALILPPSEDSELSKDLYTLRHLEGLVGALSASGAAPEVVREGVVLRFVEVVNEIRGDSNRSSAFGVRYGPGELQGRFAEKGSLSCCVDVLEGFPGEAVNLQVLRFFVEVVEGASPVVVRCLEEKFMSMEKGRLGGWLEERLLGSGRVSSPASVREMALRLVRNISGSPGIAGHLLEALLTRLERAFVLYDAGAARGYFSAVVQLAGSGEASLRKLLSSVIGTLSKLPADAGHLEGLRCLLSFLSSVLSASGAQKFMQQTRFLRSKQHPVNVPGLPLVKRVSRGDSDQSLHAADGSGDCDATSVDEDEDDNTSDGELTGLDREESDAGNSERLLASKLCTFTSSGSNFKEQHWYFCYTCDLTVSKGCCTVCAKVCHRGHKVVYSRLSRFFCDCGAGAVRGTSCQCLKPRKYTPSAIPPVEAPVSAPEPAFPVISNPDRLQLSDSDSESESDENREEGFQISVSEREEELLGLLSSFDLEQELLTLCGKLLRGFNIGIQVAGKGEVELGKNKALQVKNDVLQLKRAYKSGSLDMKVKADYPNSRELRSHLLSGSLTKSLLTISSRGRLAAGEGDKVTIFDVGQLIGQPTNTPVIVDKSTVKPVSKSSVRFEVVRVLFNPANESFLAVAGYEDCLVFTVNPRGEVTDRLALELALEDTFIRQVSWLPRSQVELMVVTNRFVKIYDLSLDKISPLHYFTVIEDEIADAALLGVSHGELVVLVLSQRGVLYQQRVSRGGSESGARILTDVVQVPGKFQAGRGVSLWYSSSLKLVFASFSEGVSLIGRLNGDATGFEEVSGVVEGEQEKPAGLHHWKEVFDGSGFFSCLSGSKSNSASIVQVQASELQVQHLRVATSLRVDGVASYRSMTKEKSHLLVLYDDGSMHVFLLMAPAGETTTGSGAAETQKQYPSEQLRKLGAAILSSRPVSPPVFPLDFFEKTTCITSDIKLGGDILRNTDSDGVKLSLASDDGFLESPSANGFKMLVFNSAVDMVMVGCRVHVGNTSASHIPSEIKIFQRTIRLEEGVRCWYDIPFTSSEALLADEEFSITIGPTFNNTSLPRIDSFEVYARVKEEFGWKEKLDAVLDSENQGSASVSSHHTGASKAKKFQVASTLDQVFYEVFKVLSGYYSLHRLHPVSEEFSLEKCKEKCIPVLEAIFGSDRQSLLQSAGRRVLRALSPNKEAYYQAKDLMSLTGVARACPLLAAKLSKGGFRMSWVVQEFSSQVRTVCKVSLQRPANLAVYLERNGSSMIESLVSLLLEILSLSEHLDTQTINDLVVLTVDLIYGYAECLAAHLSVSSVSPAVQLIEKLLFSPHDAVRASCSLALSSRLLQVPLPKQTMLAMDDPGENSRTGSMLSESGNSVAAPGQMLDEDPGTAASVQYCCDGCTTVPIQRRRWHCTVCPDFDLCEACFEVMDADQLPPPHSRDHPMSAIPIEADPGVDNNTNTSELQFTSIDDLSEESLLQMATELSLQASPAPPPHPPQEDPAGNETGEFSEGVTDPGSRSGSFSASKRLVNSLLLSGLLENLRGWTRNSSGTMAVPVMQLFYRLTTGPSSLLLESSSGVPGLERVVRVMLDELDVSGSPVNVRSRSGSGEVAILVFMLFTLLLRHWHQPGSVHGQARESETGASSSGAESFDRACDLLRQQTLVNFLLTISQQLSHVFKGSSSRGQQQESGSASANAPCGALLSARRELAAGSFTPFFSDSYAKAHKGDLFGEFHKLMLESVFRLAYSLLRPGKTSEKPEKDSQGLSKGCPGCELRLDGWQDVLCGYINNPHTSFIRKYARRLLLHLCGSKTHYYNVRDAWLLNREVKKLCKLVQKSGGFQVPIAYEKSVKVLKCLSLIGEVASSRPRNWQKYVSRHSDVLPFLLNGCFCFGEELVVQTLKLLTMVFYSGRDLIGSKDGDGGGGEMKMEKKGEESGSDKACLDMKQAVEQLAGEDGRNLKNFLDSFLLEWNATSVRSEAKTVLSGAWFHGEEAFRVLLLTLLLDRIPMLPAYGQNVQEFTELLSWLLRKGTQEIALSNPESVLVQGCLTGNTIKKIFETLRLQNELLANHPNSRIYSTLVSLVEFDGYYLESEPCLACNSPEIPYNRMKLETIKAETKFTDNRILVKCIGSHTIQSVTMNVHDPRRSKSIRVLNLYYNNRVVADLSELKNNRSLWKRARSCQLNFGQTELKVEFPIPITACNFMIELDSFYENLQAASLESLQCPRCSRVVTDKHGICSNCHENAYQCRQCRNINYENLDSFLCNECGYSKYGRFEFNFMAKPSYTFDRMENDEDMKKGLSAIEAESENAHKRYQQLLNYKKPLLKLVSSIGETEVDSQQQQQKDSVQQMVSLPGSSSFKINRKIAILGVLYGEKCKMAFDSVSKSVQTLQGLRRVLMSYLERKRSSGVLLPNVLSSQRHPNRCFGCANTFVGHCLEWLQLLARIPYCKVQLVGAGILSELFENNIHQGPKSARIQARGVLSAFTEGDGAAVAELNSLVKQKVMYCLEHHRSMDIAACVRDELQLLSESCSLGDDFWEARLRVAFQLLFRSIQVGARNPVIAEHIILPALRIISQACTPPKAEVSAPENLGGFKAGLVKNSALVVQEVSAPKAGVQEKEKDFESGIRGSDLLLVNYVEWKSGATYGDFMRRLSISQKPSPRASRRSDALALKYVLRWKRKACKLSLSDDLRCFEDSNWVRELALSACSQPIRQEICSLIELLCSQSIVRKSKFLDLLMNLLPASRTAGESAAEYFDLLFKMIETEDARLYLTVRGFLRTSCSLISEEVVRVEAQERSFHTDISQGYTLHKLIELLNKFLQVPNIRRRFIKDDLLAQVLEALLVIRGLVVQKTKLISDCGRLLRELLDNLLEESYENKRHFLRACISGLQNHNQDTRDRRCLFILEQICNIICPTKPEPAYMMVLNKAHTQEEFIRGSMTKNPYSSLEVGPLMRDVKNKICQQLEMIALLEDDYSMELLVAGNIISLDLSVAQVYEQVWRKAHNQVANSAIGTSLLSAAGLLTGRECPPMTVTYRLQGLDGEATEPIIKELDDEREETQDPEVEFAIADVMKESGGLVVLLNMIQRFTDDEIKSGQEQVALVLKLFMFCSKIRGNRQALLKLGALDVLLETANKAFSSAELVERLLLIVECLVTEANETDFGVTEGALSTTRAGSARGEQASKSVLMFLERLSNPITHKPSKHQRNSETIARILPYLTYGEPAAMVKLVDHFAPYLLDWGGFDRVQRELASSPKDAALAQKASREQFALDNFVRMSESIKLSPSGEVLKDIILEKQIVAVAIRYLKEAFPLTAGRSDHRSSPEWTKSLDLPSVPIILSMLRGLSRGHRRSQEFISQEGTLPLLHALEAVTGENEIGARAEILLDTLSDKESTGEGFLSEAVSNLRETTEEEKRKRALQRREQMLKELGMSQTRSSDGGERIVISNSKFEGLEDVEEEEAGLACMVCREGYKLRPGDMLGAYSYSKRVNIGSTGVVHSRAEWVYTTVSHFNAIHFQCHQEAKRADASLKNPKKEWEGAALRNNETLCNSLFPIRGPAVSLAHYSRCVDTFWDNLNSLGRADGTRLRLLTYDIVLMLGRFATGASFSTDSKGGGKDSNSRLLPFMFQMARHLLDLQGPAQKRELMKSLQSYLQDQPGAGSEILFRQLKSSSSPGVGAPGTPPQRTSSSGASDDSSVQYMLVQSLLLHSFDEWQQHRKVFIQRGAMHAFALHKQGRMLPPASPSPPGSGSGSGSVASTAGSLVSTPRSPIDFASMMSFSPGGGDRKRVEVFLNPDLEQVFQIVQPMLVFIGLIEILQRFFKRGRRNTSGGGDEGGEAWEAGMKEKLRDVSGLLGFSREVVKFVEEMQGSGDLQESLDIMEVLGDVLAGDCSSVEEFFREAMGLRQEKQQQQQQLR